MTFNLLRYNKKGIVKRFKVVKQFSQLIKKHNSKLQVKQKRTSCAIGKELHNLLHSLKDFKRKHRGLRYARDKDLLHNGSFQEAIGPILVMAQCFCLMPVRGILSKNAKGLSFSWYSFRTGYCLLYMLTTILDTMLTINMVIHVQLDVRNIEPFIFHISIFLASVGFLRLASKWPKLMRRWQEVEEQLPAFSNWREREELSHRIKTVTFVLITLSLSKHGQVVKLKYEAEHLLSTISAIHFANYCPATDDPIESFFLNVVDQIFYVFDYSPWLAWMGKIQNVLLTFGWSYMDVFVMNIGMGLSSMFKRVQSHMEKFQGLSMHESFWAESRYQYTLICDLIDEVDQAVSGIIMLSFANNLYFVCIQCLKSINTQRKNMVEVTII